VSASPYVGSGWYSLAKDTVIARFPACVVSRGTTELTSVPAFLTALYSFIEPHTLPPA
jgi:hypothetical protein